MSEFWHAVAAYFSQLAGADGETGLMILQIIWIDLLLSGDNAVVIALAVRGLPAQQRFTGIMLGASVAVLLRIVFTLGLQYGLELPFLKLAGALALLWIAVKLIVEDDGGIEGLGSSRTILGAIKTIAIADAIMSLDNVLAIAAVARGHPLLIAFGLALSIPLIVVGASLIMGLLHRLPILVWAGAALLGWIAGQLVAEEPMLHDGFANAFQGLALSAETGTTVLSALAAGLVVVLGALWPRGARPPPPASSGSP